MKKTITILFLFFTISTAFRPLSITTIHHDDHVSNDVVLTTKSPDPNNDDQITTTSEAVRLPEESETTTQTLFVARPTMIYYHNHHPIRFSRSNRHFYNDETADPRIPLRFVRRHPCRNYFLINNNNNNDNQPSLAAVELDKRSIPSGNDVVLTSDDLVPSKWLEFKHEYGHRHHLRRHRDDNDAELSKYEIDGDKLQMHHHHHHQHKGGFMRAIRKFLKHAFD